MNFLYSHTVQSSFSNIKKSASFVLALFLVLSSVSSAFAQEIDTVTPPVTSELGDQVPQAETTPVVDAVDVSTEPAPAIPVADEPIVEDVIPTEEKPVEEQPILEDPEMAAMEGISGPPEFIGKTSESSDNRVSSQIDDLTGSFVYEYAVTVPPGRNKMTPDLALTYNSANAVDDSVVGSGWDFNIPSIERINRKGTNNLYTENYFHSSFDGELISTSTGMYAAKVEGGNYLKYQFSSSTWTVTDKEGTVYKFGNTASARQDNASNTAQVFKWMLEEVRDTNDNYISYEYYKDAGQIYPSKITYTGNGSIPGILEVNFVRESRTSVPTSYSTGFSVKSNYRISEIRTEINDVWARKYTLSYTTGDNGSGSFLNTIIESGQDDLSNVVTLPAVDFDYQVATTSWTYNSSLTIPVPFIATTSDTGLRTADINGDGLLDLLCHNHKTGDIYCPSSSPKIYLNNGSGGWTDVSSTWLFPFQLGGSSDREAFSDDAYADSGLRTFDVNGDGLTDLVRAHGGYTGVYINNGSGWTYNASSSFPVPFMSSAHLDTGVRTADVNGDGLQDILCHNAKTDDTYCPNATSKIYLNDGSGGWTDVSSTWLFPFIPGQSINREVFLNYSTSTSLASDSALRLSDLNGDGLADLVRTSGASSYVFINNGSGWTYDSSLSIPLPILAGSTDVGTRMADINGDGLVDILCHNDKTGDVYCPKATPAIYLNNGSGGWTDVSSTWLFPVNASSSPDKVAFVSATYQDTGLRSLDINGDGLVDLIQGNNSDKKIYLNTGNTLANVLTKITYSQGGNTTISYKPTTFFKDGSNNLLNPEMPTMIDAVYQTTNNDGVGTTEGYTYEYQGGDYYFNTPLDRKLAGFAKISVTDSGGNVKKTYYHQGNTSSTSLGEYDDHASKIGRAYRFEEYDASGNLYNLMVDKVDKYTLGTDRNFVKVVRRTNLNYDGDSDHADTASEYTYDNTYGNLTEKIDWGKVIASSTDGSFTDTGTDKSTESIIYTANTGNYVVGLPYQDTLIDQSSNKVRESKIYYDTLSLGSVGVGNPTKFEDWVTGGTYVNNQKTYNTTYGVVTSETDPRGKVTSYTYDTYNLYPATTTNPLLQKIKYVYDYSSGKPKQVTDLNNFVYQTTYDGLDRVKEEKIPDSSSPYIPVIKTSYTYTDTSGAVKVQQTDYLNASTSRDTYVYLDGLGRPVQERKEAENSGYFNVKDTFYSNRGLILKESLLYASSGSSKTSATSTSALYTNYSYDPIRRSKTVVTALGTTSSAYDDWKTTVTNAENNVKSFYNDARGNLIQVDEINGTSTYTTNYEWNLNNKLTRITDALGNVRNFMYDGLGRRLTAEDLHSSGDGTFGSWTYAYDNAGNLTSSVNPRSQTVNYTYDDINRVLTEDYITDAGTEISYTYDSCTNGIGKLCSVSMLAGANASSTYSANGNVASETKTINGVGYTTSYTYDRQGNILTIVYPDNAESKYTFNSAGLLEKIERKESSGSYTDVISDFNYNPLDQITTQVYPNGLTTINTYDSTKRYRLSNKQTETNEYYVSSNNNPTITLTGANFTELTVGGTWTEPGYTATDTEDGTLTSSVTVTGSVNTAVVGTYQLVYSVADSQGAQATRKIRTVQVYPLMSVKALVVAGGGGGGKTTTTGFGGGGGGAGGMKDQSGISILAQSYTITVGAGGAGQTTNARGGSGGNSSFGSLVSTNGGGGGGGGSGVATGLNGGSGGGAGNNNGTTAMGISGQGNNGGSLGDGAGGGGAGAIGGNGSGTSGGNGGTGSTSAITGTSVYYAGGGGGASNSVQGQGGNGGGGWGGTSSNGTPGGANTGGGGGGGPATKNSGAGGSGIVIISYKVDGSDGVSVYSTGGATSTAGGYMIHTFNSSSTFTAIASINASNTNPTITLSGADFVELNVGGTWTELGYTATDTEDGTLTSSVVATGTVNTAVAGTYQRVYSVADSQGAQATRKMRTIVVETPPYLQKLTYTYDNVNNIIQVVDVSDTDTAKTITYAYDDLNRLITASATNTANNQNYTQNFTYNALGNLLTGPEGTYLYQGNTGILNANPHAPTSINGITYTYDTSGNLTNNSILSNTWNYKNQLTQSIAGGTTTTYGYDHTAQRVKKTIGGISTYYPNQYFEKTNATTTKYVFAGDVLIAIIEGNGVATNTSYVHTDHLGSTNVVTNNSGGVELVKDYMPFGSSRLENGSSALARGFIGQYEEGDDLSYLNARFYKSDQGQFLSQDPIFWEIEQTIEGSAVLKNPQAMNSYSYAGNNPITLKDPTGRFWWSEFYTDWDGYDVTSMSSDNGLVLKMGEVMGGRSSALAAIANNAGNIEAASRQSGVSQETLKAIIYEEQSHQFPPFGGETIIENIVPGKITGGIGVMQVSSKTSGLKNKDLLNSKTNIGAGASILGSIQNSGNSNVAGMAATYNNQGGGAHADRYGSRVNSYVSNSTYISNISRLLSQLSSALKRYSNALKKK